MTSSIITVATMKGGSGKSTLASCLAVHWHLNGRRPALIDADPQRTIARLAAREKALGGVHVVEDATEDAWKAAQRLVGTFDTVIIDTPGFRSQATLACLGVTDFVLVPVKPSPFDVDRMLDTLHILINGVERPAAGLPLCADPDDPRFRHCQAYSRRARRGRLPGARERDDKPRRLRRGGTLGRDAEPVDRAGPAARDIAAIADEVDHICDGMEVKRAARA